VTHQDIQEEQNQSANTLSPPLALFDIINGMWKARVVHVATQFGIADLLVAGPKGTTQLAQATGTDEPSLYRLLRACTSIGIFEEIEHRLFAQNDLSMLLRSDQPGSMYNMVLMGGFDWEWASWGDLAYSIKTGKPAFDHVQGMDLWQYLALHPNEYQVFNRALSAFTESMNLPIVMAYDFSPIHTLMDLGGGHGSFLMTILQKTPTLHGILFDQSAVIEGARVPLAASGLENRCTLLAGNFLEDVPSGADAYILKQVLHDWADEQCLIILRNCRRVIPDHGKLLVVDVVMPEIKASSAAAFFDLVMLVDTPGGRERTEAEYYQLFEKAGFTLTRVIPTGTPRSILEGVPA
jgi:ubiquinone/menaquinone biosynthesis C-methylase UbiE